MILRTASSGELGGRTLYALLRLRLEVFVVEQQEPYAELDGRDLEPGVRHCWIEDGGEPLACLRMLPQASGGSEIGRVVTAADARGRGLATMLMRHAIGLAKPPVTLSAQSHLREWYERFGFEVTGAEFRFPGEQIPHVPMTRR